MNNAIQLIDWNSPINWYHPLNRELVSWWLPVPGRTGFGTTTLRDLCGNYDGTLSSFNNWKTESNGHWGSASFNDASARITVSSGWILKDFSVGSTVTAVVRPDNADSSEDSIYAENAGAGVVGPRLIKTGGNVFDASTGDSGATFYSATGTTTITAGELYHVVGTFDVINSTIKLYVNSVLEGTNSAWNGTYYTSFNDASLIGDYTNAGTYSWGGEILSVKIHKRPLSANDVQLDYLQSKRYYQDLLRRESRKKYFVQAGGGGTTIPAVEPGVFNMFSTLSGGIG